MSLTNYKGKKMTNCIIGKKLRHEVLAKIKINGINCGQKCLIVFANKFRASVYSFMTITRGMRNRRKYVPYICSPRHRFYLIS